MKSIAGNKTCSSCRKKLKDKDFPKHKGTSDGLDYWCRKCNKIRGRKWRINNRDIVRKIKSKWNKKNKKIVSEYHKKWRYKNKKLNRIHHLARAKLHYAIKIGKIKRKPCQICKNNKSHAHHPNYLKPLKVIWLCAFHHYHKGR